VVPSLRMTSRTTGAGADTAKPSHAWLATAKKRSSTGADTGPTYAQMGRYQPAAAPNDPAGTNDEAAAAKDENGQPISNGARNFWVTETALSTALNVSYLAEHIALFGIVVGIALLLSGIGFLVLAIGGALRRVAASEPRSVAPPPTPAAALR